MSDSNDDQASADADGHTPGKSDAEERVCMACHGSGKVISNLGGLTSKVTCPWCRGGGERLTGMDAQEFQQEQATAKRR